MSPFREQNSAREVTEHSWYLIFGFLPDVHTVGSQEGRHRPERGAPPGLSYLSHPSFFPSLPLGMAGHPPASSAVLLAHHVIPARKRGGKHEPGLHPLHPVILSFLQPGGGGWLGWGQGRTGLGKSSQAQWPLAAVEQAACSRQGAGAWQL